MKKQDKIYTNYLSELNSKEVKDNYKEAYKNWEEQYNLRTKITDISILISLGLIIGLLILSGFNPSNTPTDIKVHCSLHGIEYKDISPNKCWVSGIDSKYCPLPRDVDCDLSTEDVRELKKVFE